MTIKQFVSDICDILNIDIPSVSYDTSNFPTKTMMAQCSPDGSTIYLKKYNKSNPDQFFTIAHEMRHIWQMQNDWQLHFNDYKPVNLCSSIEEYNLQIAELDANAFAGLIMIGFFRLKPLFKGFSQPVIDKIYDRIEYLKSTGLLE